MTSQYQKLAMAFFHPSLREDPFNPEDSARYFYLADSTTKRSIYWCAMCSRRGGLSIIYGDVGMGKSSLLAVLRQRMRTATTVQAVRGRRDPRPVAGHATPNSPAQMLIAFDQKPYGSTRSELSDQFIIFLQRQAREGQVPLLLIDEGQGLSYDALERLRIFLNYSLDDHRILQIVVFGQLELLEKVAKKRNLASRVRFTMTLEPLRSGDEVRDMIEHRLRTAGLARGRAALRAGAIEAVYQALRRRAAPDREYLLAVPGPGARGWTSARSTPRLWSTCAAPDAEEEP